MESVLQSAPLLSAQGLADPLLHIAAHRLHLETSSRRFMSCTPARCFPRELLLQLKSSKYGSRQDFQADFHQMLEVCQLYNTAASLAAHPGAEHMTAARCTLCCHATLPVHSGAGHITQSHCTVHNAAASLAAHLGTSALSTGAALHQRLQSASWHVSLDVFCVARSCNLMHRGTPQLIVTFTAFAVVPACMMLTYNHLQMG